jgi:hypothetical protein
VLCIVVPLPPGIYPLAVNNNKNIFIHKIPDSRMWVQFIWHKTATGCYEYGS